MTNSNVFDVVTVGGGMGASVLAIVMARSGARVLVLEKETKFRDRVRGEGLVPWGVAEARELGIADCCSRHAREKFRGWKWDSARAIWWRRRRSKRQC